MCSTLFVVHATLTEIIESTKDNANYFNLYNITFKLETRQKIIIIIGVLKSEG